MTVVFRDDFATLDSSRWGRWASGGSKSPYIRNRKLVIPFDANLTTNTVGVSSRLQFIYGKVSFRMKATAAAFKICPNLWPANGIWTTEVDIAEGSNRLRPTQTLHYGDSITSLNKGDHFMVHRHYDVAQPGLADWHVPFVEWTEGKLAFGVDGAVLSTIEDAHVPQIPMGIHLQVGVPGSLVPESGEMLVDWVQVEQ